MSFVVRYMKGLGKSLKKLIEFLSAPVVNLVVGFILILLLSFCESKYDAFDRVSALIGAFITIAIDIFGSGFSALLDLRRSKNSSGQDLDE